MLADNLQLPRTLFEKLRLIRHFRFLWTHWFLLLLLFGSGIAAALLEGTAVSLVYPLLQGTNRGMQADLPFFLKKISDFFAPFDLKGRLQIVAMVLVGITLLKNGLIYAGSLITSKLQLFVIRHFRLLCISELFRADMNYLHRHRISDFQNLIDGYTDSTTGAIVTLIGSIVSQVLTAILLVAILFALSWKLTLFSLIIALIASILLGTITAKILPAASIVYEARLIFSRGLLDIINGMKLIRVFNQQSCMQAKYEHNIEVFNRAKFRADCLNNFVSPAFETIGFVMLGIILLGASFLLGQNPNQMLGILLTFIVVVSRLIPPLKTLNQTRATVSEKIPTFIEILTFLSPEGKIYLKNGKRSPVQLKKGIRFSDVWFGYNPKECMVLQGVDFQIQRGQKVGIVGTSGAGKSTIIELLLRFYDPQKGAVLVDGFPLTDLDIDAWRKNIGMVSQDVFLFYGTIRENIGFSKEHASESEIIHAAQQAYADEFIRELPKGYDTVTGERGVMLSGGQRQRIAIARAILAEPEILIFDEATSSLDSESEKFVQKALDTVGKGRTVITIAHRLSTIFDSDQIVVLDAGKVAESGKHEELLKRNGIYKKLVQMQEMKSNVNLVVTESLIT